MPMQFHFQDRGPHRQDGHFGHRFDLRIVFGQRRGAQLAWFERCDRPYDPDMPQDTWVDMHLLLGARSPLFAQWLETTVDSGRVEIDFDHWAAMRQEPYAQRSLEWCVVAVDGDEDAEDDGHREWAMWRGVQQLSCDSEGRVVDQSMRTIDSLHGRSGQPPSPDQFPHY
ncbi:hypothetical protein [Pseudomonas sp. CGJS7]|uniref:hypothetical protein n=1 Tax=Pseudomonas sp. CGJS7 TaxID=3109348 RepID=UPI00300B107D